MRYQDLKFVMMMLSILMTSILILNVFPVFCSAEGDISETSVSVADSETSFSYSPNDSGFDSLTEHQQIIFLLAVIAGMFLAAAFNFFKW